MYLVKNVGILQSGSQHGNMIVEDVQRDSKPEELDGVTQIMYRVREMGQRIFDLGLHICNKDKRTTFVQNARINLSNQ
jgi:hypothetical protein